MKSYLRDGQQLIDSLKEITISPNVLLYTCDVIPSLYACIPHIKRIDTIKACLLQEDNMKNIQCVFIVKCITFCLTHNYFWFHKTFYNQVSGTAMGAWFAPSYANLYMENWEVQYLYASDIPYKDNILIYKKYIDDI